MKIFVVRQGQSGKGGITFDQPVFECFVFVKPLHDSGFDAATAAAHEVGHVLELEHDTGAFPPESNSTNGGLMNTNGALPGKWLRNENWKTTNKAAALFRP